jgi:adenosylcobinamide-GDP ribazoletransferase
MRAAVIFMSRIPAGGFPYSEAEFRAAPGHFPFVGLLVGGVAGPVLLAAQFGGSFLAAALTVFATVWTTGAFHEDGLADTADALGGAHSRKKIHDILKDSRIGTYGSAAPFFSLLLRVLLLARLIDDVNVSSGRAVSLLPPFVLVHVLSRLGPLGLMASSPYVAGEGAKGSAVAQGGDFRQFMVGCVWAAGASGATMACGLPPVAWGFLVLTATLVSVCLRKWFLIRAGGVTGDFLGATEQALEIALFLCLLLLSRFGMFLGGSGS